MDFPAHSVVGGVARRDILVHIYIYDVDDDTLRVFAGAYTNESRWQITDKGERVGSVPNRS